MIKTQLVALVVILVLATAICATADPEPVSPFLAKAFSAMGATAEIKPLISSTYNFNNTFAGTILSDVWSLSDGDYLYLYQAANSGPSALELLGVAPFYDIEEVGYISDGAPAGFVSDGKLPVKIDGDYSVTYDVDGDNVSFGYLGFIKNGAVTAGQHTSVLYLISSKSPVLGTVCAMDSGVASADGWTSSVPEPSSLVAFGLGAAMLLRRRRRA